MYDRRSGQAVIRSTLRSLGRELGSVSRATHIPQDVLCDFIEERTLLAPHSLQVLTAYLFSGDKIFDAFLDELRPSVKIPLSQMRGACRLRG
jgi:hypothetical protein